MPKVQDILSEKGGSVQTISAKASVVDAAMAMNEHRIGALVLTDNDRLVGIFTERDVLRRVVARELDPATTAVGDVMTSDVVCCGPTTSIDEARAIMRDRRIRHLPVVTAERELIGLVSIGDLNAFRLDGQEQTIHSLKEYLYGAVTPA